MFAAASGKTKIVDGYESSYGYKEPKQFEDARQLMTQRVPAMLGDALAQRYKKHGSVGFGIWMDYDWRNQAWDEKDLSRNHFSPEQFEASVRKALETSDEYVWIYTETPKWWTPPGGKPEKLPAEYDWALHSAVGKQQEQ